MPDYIHAPGLAMPARQHTLTPAAEHARQAVRDFAARRNAERAAPPELVTEILPVWHPVPSPSTLSGAPITFANAARAAGHEVELWQAGDAIEVRVNRGAIRAWWKGGQSTDVVLMGTKSVSVTLAKYTLTMPLAEAEARYQRESDARKAAAAAKRAEKAAL